MENICVKVHFISDLHVDMHIKEQTPGNKMNDQMRRFADSLNLLGNADVLILAGDLGHYYEQNISLLKELRSRYSRVLSVTGNHDRYLVGCNARKYDYSKGRVDQMEEFCNLNGVDLLNGDVVEINGVTFGGLGGTWDGSYLELLRNCKVSEEELETLFNRSLNDSRYIYESDCDILEYRLAEFHKITKIPPVDVFVSHYGPAVQKAVAQRFRLDEASTFFYMDPSEVLNRIAPAVWVYGHTHDSNDFDLDNTRCLVNPLGYPRENANCRVQSFTVLPKDK